MGDEFRMSEERAYELLTGIDNKLNNINTKSDAMSVHLDRIENKIAKIELELNKTSKTTHDNAKDIEFMQAILNRIEIQTKDEFETVWEKGINKTKKIVEDYVNTKAQEERADRIRKDAVKDMKLWLAGCGVVLLGKIIFDVIFG